MEGGWMSSFLTYCSLNEGFYDKDVLGVVFMKTLADRYLSDNSRTGMTGSDEVSTLLIIGYTKAHIVSPSLFVLKNAKLSSSL
jgi:hypothetical protein